MVFPKLKLESVVQVGDLTRLDASFSSIKNLDDVANVELITEEDETPISIMDDLQENWFLDFIYSSEGEKEVELIITTGEGLNEETFSVTKTILVVTELEDNLFSKDDDITPIEPDIYRYLPEGKNSFVFIHRAARDMMLAWLDEQRIWKEDGSRYDSSDTFDFQEFNHWSKYLALHIIFNQVNVTTDDFFQRKAAYYMKLAVSARQRASFRLSRDGSGDVGKEVVKDRVVSIMVKR